MAQSASAGLSGLFSSRPSRPITVRENTDPAELFVVNVLY